MSPLLCEIRAHMIHLFYLHCSLRNKLNTLAFITGSNFVNHVQYATQKKRAQGRYSPAFHIRHTHSLRPASYLARNRTRTLALLADKGRPYACCARFIISAVTQCMASTTRALAWLFLEPRLPWQVGLHVTRTRITIVPV